MLHSNIATQSQLRVSYSVRILSKSICSSRDSYAFFMEIWNHELINLQEQVYILYLNNNNEVISWRLLNTGSGNESTFDIKFALSCGLNCMASKMIIAHNHPSVNLKPSQPDIAITEKLKRAAELIDIKLIEHIIISTISYFSFVDHTLLFEAS